MPAPALLVLTAAVLRKVMRHTWLRLLLRLTPLLQQLLDAPRSQP